MKFFAERITGWLGALIGVALALYVAHQIGKMPDDPALAPLPEMYKNFAFVMALGLGVPWPGISSLFILLLIAWLGYRVGFRLGGILGASHR